MEKVQIRGQRLQRMQMNWAKCAALGGQMNGGYGVQSMQ